MRILFVTSEAYPLIKTGGLADVSGSLPAAIAEMGEDIRILIPGYPLVLEKLINPRVLASISDLPVINSVTIISGEMPETKVPVLAINCPSLYQRAGGPYVDTNGVDWGDNALRFGILSKIAAILGTSNSYIQDWIPDIVHCNDWQSALTPAYLKFMGVEHAKSVVSIHNMAFQGCFPSNWLSQLELPYSCYQMNGLEYYGQISFLKAGLYYCDVITTVSPTYAKEIQTENYGFGMQGLLSHRSHEIHGILNGIDIHEWDPSKDHYLDTHYSHKSLDKKREVKQSLQKQLDLTVDNDAPLLGIVSRLTYQKGLDMFLSVAEKILKQGCQIALLGSGEKKLEDGFIALKMKYPDKVSINIGYNEPLSHAIMAGSDLFIMPSRFEPCGLNQMYGLRYGTPPVVTNTGGLADSIRDTTPESISKHEATGFVMDNVSEQGLLSSIQRALGYYENKEIWRGIQLNGMRKDLSWKKSAREYLAIYKTLLAK